MEQGGFIPLGWSRIRMLGSFMAVSQVWCVDCENCGTFISYGEDRDAVPTECEECGSSTEDD